MRGYLVFGAWIWLYTCTDGRSRLVPLVGTQHLWIIPAPGAILNTDGTAASAIRLEVQVGRTEEWVSNGSLFVKGTPYTHHTATVCRLAAVRPPALPW